VEADAFAEVKGGFGAPLPRWKGPGTKPRVSASAGGRETTRRI
jgi:hypothetical protein